MPPPYLITQDQRRALDALQWLHDESETHRRQGRTWVLAISYLRRLVFGRARDLDVEDHLPGHQGASVLMEYIEALGAELGLEVEIHRSRSQVRLVRRPLGANLQRVSTALTAFGHREPFPTAEFMQARMVNGELKTNRVPRPPTTPRKTLWEQLDEDTDDSDGI